MVHSIFSCQVIISNTTKNATVTVFDTRSGKKVSAHEGQVVNGNTDPDQRANLIVSIAIPGKPIKNYKITQFACSKSHAIPITSQEIVHGFSKQADAMQIDKLLRVEKIMKGEQS